MNPVTQPPYPWAEHATRIGYDEPGHTFVPDGLGYDFTIDAATATTTLTTMRTACWGTTGAEEN